MAKTTKATQSEFSILGFLWESKAALVLIGLNVAAFFYLQHGQGVKTLDARPWIAYPGAIIEGRLWTLITSGFLHADQQHLWLNCLGMFVFGRIVEDELGFWQTLGLYLGSLVISIGAALTIYYFFLDQNAAVVGASGAVMGLVSVSMLLAPLAITWEMIVPIPVMFKGWLFIFADMQGFLSGESDGVSHLAHLCGYVSIAVVGYFLSERDKSRLIAGFIVNVLSLIMFAYVIQELLQGR